MLIRQGGFSISSETADDMPFRFNLILGLTMVICFMGGLILMGLPTIFGDVFNIYTPDMKFTVQTVLFCIGLVLFSISVLIFIFLWRRES